MFAPRNKNLRRWPADCDQPPPRSVNPKCNHNAEFADLAPAATWTDPKPAQTPLIHQERIFRAGCRFAVHPCRHRPNSAQSTF